MRSILTHAMQLLTTVAPARARDDRGAVGWFILGAIVGAIALIVLLVQLIIPGD